MTQEGHIQREQLSWILQGNSPLPALLCGSVGVVFAVKGMSHCDDDPPWAGRKKTLLTVFQYRIDR